MRQQGGSCDPARTVSPEGADLDLRLAVDGRGADDGRFIGFYLLAGNVAPAHAAAAISAQTVRPASAANWRERAARLSNPPLPVLVAVLVCELGSVLAGLRKFAAEQTGRPHGPSRQAHEPTNPRTDPGRASDAEPHPGRRPNAVPHTSRCLTQRSIPAPQSPSAGQEPECRRQPISE